MEETKELELDELDEEEEEEAKKKLLAERIILEAYGRTCPDQYINILTPMEFDDIALMFNNYDVDKSNTIDKHEAKKILFDLGMDYGAKQAEELFEIIDEDGSGEINFDEFCGFIIMIKKGDPRLEGFNELLEQIKTSPLGILEAQVNIRDLKMRFITLEERPATNTSAESVVVELQLSGVWVSLQNGRAVETRETRKFQGIGYNNRKAKEEAASAALIKLSAHLPGIKYREGELPEEWLHWANENLDRGVECSAILNVLVSKGFKPQKNIAFMQRIGAWLAFSRYMEKTPDFELSDTSIDIGFQAWVKSILNRGIDGNILLKVLEDRGLLLGKEHPHFAQQLNNNELGTVIEYDGVAPKILDFWQACSDGDTDLVRMYCECLQDVNEEKIGRNDSISRTPLMLASMNNHPETMKVLIDFKAEVRAIDRSGRTAIHLAAMKGSTEACILLLKHGARLYDRDFRGDTPLHLAAYGNNPVTVDFLAYQARELTRSIISDKVLCRSESNFAKLTAEVFEDLPRIKLNDNQTLRFEKVWLRDATLLFIQRMDPHVSQYLAPISEDVMNDVLNRFDPRPETGIKMYNSLTAEYSFVKTIANADSLEILLGYAFRQSSIDSGNNWKRTALHLACDGNKVNSHEKTILMLIDVHGASSIIKDRYGHTPMSLLIENRNFSNSPSATREREEIIFKKREERLYELNMKLSAVEENINKERRQRILESCIEITNNFNSFLWNITRESSILRTVIRNYEEYIDPDTRTLFYCKQPLNPLRGDVHSDFTWFKPNFAATPLYDRKLALSYLTTVASLWLRTLEDWKMYRLKSSEIVYYYHIKKDVISFRVPKKCHMLALYKKYRPEPRKRLGFSNEWIEYFIPAANQSQKAAEVATVGGEIEHCLKKDADGTYGYILYRNNNTLEDYMSWDRPVDAIEIPTKMKFCTAVQTKDKPIVQVYYTCEECNRAWSGVTGGKNPPVRLCEPCVLRCHRGHKGVRKVREAKVSCICETMCTAIQCMCNARKIDQAQLQIQQFGFEERIEWKRREDRDRLNPLIFAPTPGTWPDGNRKRIGGWTICRRPPLRGFYSLGLPEADESSVSLSASQSQVSLDSATSSGEEDDESDDENEEKMKKRKELQKLRALQNQEDFAPDNFLFIAPTGLPSMWIEVTDMEEESVYEGCRVLAYRHRTGAGVKYANTPVREYGVVLKRVGKLMYLIQFDDTERLTVGREYIEIISKRSHFCNIETGLLAWTIDEAIRAHKNFEENQITLHCPLILPGPLWMFLNDRSFNRRSFKYYDEMEDDLSNLIFYADELLLTDELAAIKIQKFIRSKLKFFVDLTPWISTAFTITPPDEVIKEFEDLNGWTYIRRRSTFIGEFNSALGEEWEEYMDSVSSEYLYWHEDSNSHQWIKPPLNTKTEEESKNFKVDDEVMFRFAGDYKDDIGIITTVRQDDETGEMMYDVVRTVIKDFKRYKMENAVPEKWVARFRLKKPILDKEALMLHKLDLQLTEVLRRAKAADERKKKKQKQEKMNEALSKIRERLLAVQAEEESDGIVTLKDDDASTSENQVAAQTAKEKQSASMSAAQLLANARIRRAKQETLETIAEKERKDAVRRKDAVNSIVESKKSENQNLTRSEVLSLQRAIDMKLQMEDRIIERNLVQKELIQRNIERKQKIDETEEMLRCFECNMTTPRSLIRRRLLRRVHSAIDRQNNCYVICDWGCGDFVKSGQDQSEHQSSRCPKRIIGCALLCPIKLSQEQWFAPVRLTQQDVDAARLMEFQAKNETSITNELSGIPEVKSKFANVIEKPVGPGLGNDIKPEDEEHIFEGMTVQQYHEQLGCPKRLVPCPLMCLEWVRFEILDNHIQVLCVKRPAKSIHCRLGCGAFFGGTTEKLIEAEEERHIHEEDQCMNRIVRCIWKFDDGRQCAAQMMAKDREEHRDYHLALQGISTYLVAGTYIYNVPKRVNRLKIQVWGGGGGAGHFKNRKGGNGGGGAFVEAIISVDPYDVLELVVGAGGGCGVHGTEIEIKRKPPVVIAGRIKQGSADDVEVVDSTNGIAVGGDPGGGDGFGGGSYWACGGGGGYSCISKRTVLGNETLAVAAGGGGAGSLDGCPGGTMVGSLPGTKIDKRNGETATSESPGHAGDSGSIFNTDWPAEDGAMWQGGKGSQYGGGGGGGYFGGGGGGTSPGVGGGGGGGSSYIHEPKAIDYVMIAGHGNNPGGMDHNPPEAVGLGEWDTLGVPVGSGGMGDLSSITSGKTGCIRIYKPGYYS